MIELKDVCMNFDKYVALSHINLTVKKGCAFGLLGANGAGKSTILRILAGIYHPMEGEVTIDGEPVFDNIRIKDKVFFINDETVQYNHYTLNELCNYYQPFYPNYDKALFNKLREQVKLPLDKKIAQFSKGMKRQAVMIIALACQPEYLLMDEAFDGLDPTMRNIVKNMLIDAMIDRKMTTIISSHNLKEIGQICDSIALVYQGQIVFSREIEEVTDNIHKLQLAFDKEMEKEVFAGLNIMHYETNGSLIHMIVKGTQEEIKSCINPMNPIVFDCLPLSLEEVFIYEMEGLGYECSNSEN